MNKVILIGRLTKDPEVRNTSNQTAFTNFTIAVDRRFKDNNGQRQADFINCIAWRQTATFIGSYFRKGSRIALSGSLQSRSYDDNQGQKRYVTEVVVDEVEFADSANGGRDNQPSGNYTAPEAAYPQQNAQYNAPAPQYAQQQAPQYASQAPVQQAAPAAPAPSAAPEAPKTAINPAPDDGDFSSSEDPTDLPFNV